MKYKITKGDYNKEMFKDIEKKLDDNNWCGEDCTKEIMLVPLGVVRRNGKVEIILNADVNLIK